MMRCIYSDRVLYPQGPLRPGYLVFDESGIQSLGTDAPAGVEPIDATGLAVAPGFVDLHLHGGAGYDFCDGTEEEMAQAVALHLSHGTTTLCPTVTSCRLPDTREALVRLQRLIRSGQVTAHIAGVHLEGPYFSPAQCGAQDPSCLGSPDPAEYEGIVRDFGDILCRWSYAPERDPEGRFCRYLAEHGILPSIGHSDAVYRDCETACRAGARLVTHLYSCTSTVTRKNGFRAGGVIESAWLEDGLYTEIIADGRHLPPELIRLVFKIKGAGRVCLVTDAIRAAGTDIRAGKIGGTPFIVEDGVAKLPDRSAFAGSVATADRLVRTCIEEAGIPPEDALRAMSATPASLLGIPAGKLSRGGRADVVVLDEKWYPVYVFCGGKQVL